MADSTSEPDRYSIEEMIGRLKQTTPDDSKEGELVTRPDGSQMIRVRKRKRRTSQSIKENQTRTRRVRVIQVSAILILILVAALSFGFAIVFANSSGFRERVITSISNDSGASVDLKQFRVNPRTADVGHLTLEWPEGNVLQSLKLRGVSSQISPTSLFGSSMEGDEVTAAEGILTLRRPEAGKPLIQTRDKNAIPLAFDLYRIPLFHLNLGEGNPVPLRLFKSEATFDSRRRSGIPQLNLYRGELQVPGWPKMRMDRAVLEFRGDETDILNLRIMSERDDRGTLEFIGTITPFELGKSSNLAVKATLFEMDALAGSEMGRLITGRVDSMSVNQSNFLTYQLDSKTPFHLEVSFQSSPLMPLELHSFPFLFTLSEILNDSWFEKPTFATQAQGVFKRTGDLASLSDLEFESAGRMAIRGGLSVNGGKTLSGSFEVGLPEGMFSTVKNAKLDTMFSAPKEGYRWVTLTISGQASKPVDNFKELYSNAVPDINAQPVPEKIEGPTFEELTRPR